MNILVLGGLFLLGMVAVVVAILLVMSERGNENGAALAAAAPTAAMTTPSAPASSPPKAGPGGPTKRLTVPLQAAETERGNTRASLLGSQSLPTTPGRNFVHAGEDDRNSPALNGQMRELVAELRSLHIRAGDVEHRLGVLIEMVERIEHDYGGLVEVDLDEAEVSPDAPPGR